MGSSSQLRGALKLSAAGKSPGFTSARATLPGEIAAPTDWGGAALVTSAARTPLPRARKDLRRLLA
jgi:hypothetical protein